MNFTSEINIIGNLVRDYSKTTESLEGERILHYGDLAVQKLKSHNFNLDGEERKVLLEAIEKFGEGLPLVRILSLIHHPLV